MAIQIVKKLDAQQDEARLPMRIDLAQTLLSSEPSETVNLEYRLDAGVDVWFKGEPPAKTSTRRETIAATPTEIHHRVTLVHGPGEVVERAAIVQTITDSLGIQATGSADFEVVD